MTALFAKLANWFYDERGHFEGNWGIGGAVVLLILVLVFLWLAESAGKTNFFD